MLRGNEKMPDESIDFIFTSPPYANQIKDYGATGIKIKPDQFDNWFLPRAQEMYRILKSEGSFVLNINDKLDGKFQSLFVFKLVVMLVEQVGFHLVRDYIWYNPATPPNVFSRGTMGRTKNLTNTVYGSVKQTSGHLTWILFENHMVIE